MNIRILLADDHQMFREGLRALLDAQPGMEVISEAEDGQSALKLALELSPDVVVMDVGMPVLGGMEATTELIRERPDAKVVALSMYSDKRFVNGMLKAGAAGYVLKDCAFHELARAIHTVMANQKYLSPQIATVILEEYLPHLTESASVLTSREEEILRLLAEGKTTGSIAAGLGLSEKTVYKHRQRIMDKLNIHKATELVKYAIEKGMVSKGA